MAYKDFHQILKNEKENITNNLNLEKGISVILPIHDGIEYLEDCLGSLNAQNITSAKFEVIVVLNGNFTKELEYLHNQKFTDLDLIILINEEIGAGSARNLGVSNARYSHVTFVDVDDYISKDYIQAHFDIMGKNIITFSEIHDVIDDEIISDNSINQEIIDNQATGSVPLSKLNRIASITVCKVIPKEIAVLQKFREYLRSGEDTVYYSELFVNSRPLLKVISLESNAIYYRRIRENSISRKEGTFDFLVFQRLEILEILDQILSQITNQSLIVFVRSKYNAQISFMNRYLKENPSERETVLNAVKLMSLEHFNYSILNRGFAKTLVLSYCFPPYSDTSATIVAKRLINENKVVDVVSNNLTRIRTKEPSLKLMIEPLIAKNIVVNQHASFSNMFYLNSYIDAALRVYIKNQEDYSEIYSRAMFPISHIPNYFIKIINPEIYWKAEFSDPLLYNIESEVRHALVDNDVFIQSLKNGILGDFSKYVDDNLFNISELIPFALADELIFTNENQLEYMILRFNESEKEFIRKKSKILRHPTLPNEYYHLNTPELKLEKSVINIAYFGNFYSKRGYNSFIELTNQLNENFDYSFKLSLFTNIDAFTEEDRETLSKNNVQVNNYLAYTEFLNATTKFDLLLINDALTIEDKPMNPYLPSKLSDYLGSDTPILAFVEKNSIMSKIENDLLFKIITDDFEEQLESDVLYKNDPLQRLFKTLMARKANTNDRRLLYTNGVQLIDEFEDPVMTLSDDLSLNSKNPKEWLIKPKALPIDKNNMYTIQLFNNTNQDKEIKIKSFYNMKNIIKLEYKINDITDSSKSPICISKYSRSFKTKVIPSNSVLSISLKYNKNYNNNGFINAGRLHIKGI